MLKKKFYVLQQLIQQFEFKLPTKWVWQWSKYWTCGSSIYDLLEALYVWRTCAKAMCHY